ncbi:DUF2505 domain-containing protein [uncultured Corynebacterium sp.]|uniref:DUF2505 domain-containing protein n=1 Tax=uncultured Corynebacterium sp. TaxID=159447 RepID=UPI0025E92075|nr:DUF2505 domain-containing protein [uncultured Corynebacterium sp.]
MASHTEITANVNYAPDKVHEALSDANYWTYLAENLSTPAGEVVSFDNEGDRINVELKQTLATDTLPDAVKTLIKNDLIVVRKISWGPLSDGTADATVDADVTGMPVTFAGTQKLTAAGDGSAIVTGADVTVNVPMMGAILEPKVAGAVDGLFQKEAGILQEYLAKNA